MFETEKHLDSAGSILRARCPHCYKLFSIHAGEISEARPRFECTECQGQFWLPFPESLENSGGMIGFPIEAAPTSSVGSSESQTVNASALPDFEISDRSTKKARSRTAESADAKPFSCPKCGSAYAGGESECVKCGVIFQKFFTRLPVRSDFSSSKELKALWDAVILEYENEDRHRQFIQYGQGDGNLGYVLRKYQDVQEASPSDEFSRRYVKEVASLMTAQIESELSPTKGYSFFAWKDWSIPRFNFSPILYLVGTCVVVFGALTPGMKNFIGLGCSILFLALAVRFYFKKPT